MRRIVQAVILLLLSVLILFASVFAVWENQKNEIEKWDFARISAYQKAREHPDSLMTELQYELKMLEATVQGAVVLMFDQCAPNVYEKAYAQLKEYKMAGSVVFRERLPDDEGAITVKQWREMEESGWRAVLGADEALLATVNEAGYPDRLRAYVQQAQQRFAQKGLRSPVAYSFSKDEYSADTLSVLIEEGFAVFSSSEAETGMCGDNAAVFREFYISSDPKAPLLQASVEAIKNTAQVLVIKTRYVEVVEDITKDVRLDKFRTGMLNSLSVYRGAESLRVESIEAALSSYRAELASLEAVQGQRQALLAQIEAVERELERIWQQYRA
ncbi:MAG: hypothetical protein E7599_05750 [Ruminococcaceae bacterium]|nr:hypothetical protein [Oscillospiraceae bacterium]